MDKVEAVLQEINQTLVDTAQSEAIAQALGEINQSLADMVAAAERENGVAAVALSLAEIAKALNQRAASPLDLGSVVEAISSLKLSVTVEPIINVPAAQVHVHRDEFKPLVIKVRRDRQTNLVESLEIAVRG
jgi:hypothetical protein